MNGIWGAGIIVAVLGALLPSAVWSEESAGQTAQVTVYADQPGAKVSPALYGIFFEEINHAGDGGIYAEMVQNRAFEELQPAAGAKIEGSLMVTPKGWPAQVWYRSELPAWPWSLRAKRRDRSIWTMPSR
jgi:hypothetical protein